MSIADKLAQLVTIRSDIRTALTDKGVAAETHNFADFASDIADIPSGGGGRDGQYFPTDIMAHIRPAITVTHNGEGI